jgi:preprotein translocase subunit YajC
MTKETKLTKKEIQVIKALQHGDIFVSKAGVEMIVDFVTDDRVVTTVRQGTIKAPDRLVFTYQEFINGMKSLRVKK